MHIDVYNIKECMILCANKILKYTLLYHHVEDWETLG
jgi:hypothetical protein